MCQRTGINECVFIIVANDCVFFSSRSDKHRNVNGLFVKKKETKIDNVDDRYKFSKVLLLD